MSKSLYIGGGALVVGAAALMWWMSAPPEELAPGAIKIPQLSQVAVAGEQEFNQFCAGCHGENAAGTDQGPPLIHKLYVPGHHGDVAIALAAKTGVRAHHWRFGNMPPVAGITDAKIRQITRYIREVQVANGIK